jgi:hypothetical protein
VVDRLKGQTTENIIKAILMVAALLLFLFIFFLTSNAVTDYDMGCRWSVQLSAAGLPVSLRCSIKTVELTDRQIDDDLKLKSMIAEEMANCYAKFGSGRHKSIAGNNKVRWATDFKRALSNTIERLTSPGVRDCYPCTYIYSENKEIALGKYYEYLDNTVPKGKDMTYAEIMYERANNHELQSEMKEWEYNSKELFIIYAEHDEKNAVFLADTAFLNNHRICGGTFS